ncbi:hypothetical protein [Moritella yayanosii]|uniref:hypothetical protein n=1 Tax=Moritella yayanosii TaxID=69539 RepID=UPI001E5D90CF|nr:hypothetical protein [Moritella yayanosii]
MQASHSKGHPTDATTNNGKVWVIFCIGSINEGWDSRTDQPGPFTIRTGIKVRLWTDRRDAFAVGLFKVLEFSLVAESYFLTQAFTYFPASLTFSTNIPVVIFNLQLFYLPYI